MLDIESGGRRRDLIWLALSFLIVILSAIPLSELLIAAWVAEGVVYTGIHDITQSYSLNIDLFVVVPTGILIGWLCLFVFDQTKRIQAAVIVFAVIPFVFVLRSQGVWTEYVSWIELLHFVFLGLIFGLVTGSLDKILYGFQDYEFPIAGQALFFTTSVSLVIAFVDLITTISTPLTQTVRFAVSLLIFVGLFGSFIQYTNRRDVVIVSPSGHRDAEAMLITEMYNLAKSQYETRVSKGGAELNEAQANIAQNSKPDMFKSNIQFRFKPTGLFSRWSSVNAAGYDLQNLYEDQFNKVIDGIRPAQSLREKIRRFIYQLFLRFSRNSQLEDKIRTADLVIMVVPFSDARIQTPLENGTLSESSAPSYLKKYNQLCKAVGGRTDVLVAALDSEIAMKKYQEQRGTEINFNSSNTTEYQSFIFEIREWFGELIDESDDRVFSCSIVPVKHGTPEEDDEKGVINVKELLNKLE